MIALRIEDMRQFTSKLFVGETFDHFLMKEASIVTFNTFTIDGHIRRGYYTEEELEKDKPEDSSSWKVIKPFCFSLIKGKKLPESFRIVLFLSPMDTETFLSAVQVPIDAKLVTGLYVNIRYEDEKLYCITGTAVSFFTMDKTLDKEWDQALRDFLKNNQIDFTEE